MRQELLWIDWQEDDRLVTGGKFLPTGLPKAPSRVWTLFQFTDKDKPPALPYQPAHSKNAFLEDVTHDWMWVNGVFRYYTRVMDRGVWLLLEFKEES